MHHKLLAIWLDIIAESFHKMGEKKEALFHDIIMIARK